MGVENAMTIQKLKRKASFTRSEYSEVIKHSVNLTDSQIRYDLQKKIDQGTILHLGWNTYAFKQNSGNQYSHEYSTAAKNIADIIEANFYELKYQMFELRQLNSFVNHLYAHNTIFVSVEQEMIDYVFVTLRTSYPGKVMLKPSLDMYYRYLQEDQIVIERLPTQTPKGSPLPWQSRLEKILVDVLSDKLISKVVPENEKEFIVTNAVKDYEVDYSVMMRYAKRKGAAQKVADIIEEYTGRSFA